MASLTVTHTLHNDAFIWFFLLNILIERLLIPRTLLVLNTQMNRTSAPLGSDCVVGR